MVCANFWEMRDWTLIFVGVLAVTRALGDSYMKELVTGHPYTTESVLQADTDEFIILACDGVCQLEPLEMITL